MNYERLLVNKNKLKTLGQIGFAFYRKNIKTIWIPLSINQLISFKSNHIELGLGQVLTNEDNLLDDKNSFKAYGSCKVGYRYQKPDGKILLKLAFTPLIDFWDKFDNRIYRDNLISVIPWVGIAFGYNF